ncbi:MAG: CPBP family intramembrane metalloprotease [Peptococcaceae bacterium]|nr:CPBP family intramembrane metalloprotease [Peptococcaceae bacterium]
MSGISKRLLVINLIASQLLLILLAIVFQFAFKRQLLLKEIFSLDFTIFSFFIVIISSALLLLIQLIFLKFVSKERLFDPVNMYLLQNFSLKELLIIFFTGAISEELLFRATIQPKVGIAIGSLIFTIVHFRYLNKIFILIEVFIIGVILGISYHLTSSIWVPVFCHFFVNLLTAFLYKSGYFSFEKYT